MCTRGPRPGELAGTVWMTLLSNQHSGFSVARLLTAVGDSRVSIGPPIITSERGVASPRAAISDTAASTGTVGWQTLTTCRFSAPRSEEHTSELQSLMRISYAVLCMKKKKQKKNTTQSSRKHNRQ